MGTGVPAFLDHLRVDRRGLPVPYLNRWGAETVENLTVMFDRNVKAPGLFCLDVDETEPDFKAQNPQRQREIMVRGLCQVCGRQVPWSRRFLVLSSVSTEVIATPGLGHGVTVVTEPWLDRRCAEFALAKCPALIRRTREDDLTLYAVTSPRDVQLVVSTGWVEGPLEAATKAQPVAMWAKLHVLTTRLARVSA